MHITKPTTRLSSLRKWKVNPVAISLDKWYPEESSVILSRVLILDELYVDLSFRKSSYISLSLSLYFFQSFKSHASSTIPCACHGEDNHQSGLHE